MNNTLMNTVPAAPSIPAPRFVPSYDQPTQVFSKPQPAAMFYMPEPHTAAFATTAAKMRKAATGIGRFAGFIGRMIAWLPCLAFALGLGYVFAMCITRGNWTPNTFFVLTALWFSPMQPAFKWVWRKVVTLIGIIARFALRVLNAASKLH